MGWGKAELIGMDGGGLSAKPHIAVDASGNAIAVWLQDDGTREDIWANRYVAGTGWGAAELIEVDAGLVLDPQIAVDASGNAIAVWPQITGTGYSIFACQLEKLVASRRGYPVGFR